MIINNFYRKPGPGFQVFTSDEFTMRLIDNSIVVSMNGRGRALPAAAGRGTHGMN
jgi:hypothetical protein